MTKKEKQILALGLQEFFKTPKGKEFFKKVEENKIRLKEVEAKIGISMNSNRKEKLKFQRLYTEFIKTEEGVLYHEWFLNFNKEIYDVAEKFGVKL